MKIICGFVLILIFIRCDCAVRAEDWPMYRKDASRSGYTAKSLPSQLELSWAHQAADSPQPAWLRGNRGFDYKVHRVFFDRVLRTVVSDDTVMFGSSVDGKVYALNLKTGEQQWVFYTEGPVRLAPAVWKQTVFVTSDDGHLYALSVKDGSLLWKHRASPSDSLILGNERMISKWPARGGSVVFEDTVYYGTGIWPTEGFYLVALDAKTGRVQWTNQDTGSLRIKNPHGATANSGVAAQGHLVATQDQIFVPTGRAVPACFDRKTGKYKYFHLSRYGSMGPSGGDQVMVAGKQLVVNGRIFNTDDGISPMHADGRGRKVSIYPTDTFGTFTVFHPRHGFISTGNQKKRSAAITSYQLVARDRVLRDGTKLNYPGLDRKWSVPEASLPCTCLIGAGDQIISGSRDQVQIIDVNNQKVTWSVKVKGTVFGLAIADQRLLVSTDQGWIYCFGHDQVGQDIGGGTKSPSAKTESVVSKASVVKAAEEIIAKAGITHGYCLDLGCGDGSLAYELARRTKLHIIAVDSDPRHVAQARNKMDQAGLLGSRVTVLKRDLAKTGLPNYFANLVVSARSILADQPLSRSEATRVQKPYDGVLCSGRSGKIKITVRGPLVGAGSWTHQYANPENSLCNDDRLIKGALSILWYNDIQFRLPQRHGRSPAPLSDRGRLIYAGLDGLIAVDAYNGHEQWRHPIEGISAVYNGEELMGTAGTGSFYCLGGDSVFVRLDHRCYRIDATTGKLLKTHQLPNKDEQTWGYIAYSDGLLFGSIADPSHLVLHRWQDRGNMKRQFTESKTFFAMDIETGKILWQYQAKDSIRHNAIAIGTNHVYLIDRPLALIDKNKKYRRGEPVAKDTPHRTGMLIALDKKTGRVAWRNKQEIYGTTLTLSTKHRALLMSYLPQKWGLPSELHGRKNDTRMAVFALKDGERRWDKALKYQTRPTINDQTIYTPAGAWDLKTGESLDKKFSRGFGCGLLTSSRHLMLFRSGTLGYFNLAGSDQVQYFGGVRPGCWINVIPAGGIVLAPNGSTGCACNYLNESWFALQPKQ